MSWRHKPSCQNQTDHQQSNQAQVLHHVPF
jgi:hypothetical protein